MVHAFKTDNLFYTGDICWPGYRAGLWLVCETGGVRRVDPQHLRQDYQTDYVLMVAETYASEGNAANAVERLHFLGNEQVNVYVRQAILIGGQAGYSQQDIETMNNLSLALQSWIPQSDGGTP